RAPLARGPQRAAGARRRVPPAPRPAPEAPPHRGGPGQGAVVGARDRATAPEDGNLTVGSPGYHDHDMNSLQRAEAADHAAIEELDRLVIVKSTIYTSGARGPPAAAPPPPEQGKDVSQGACPAPAENAREADPVRLLQVPLRPRQSRA